MRRPPNESEDSARESLPDWIPLVLQRKGLLFGGASELGQATCVEVREQTLVLVPLSSLPLNTPNLDGTLLFQISNPSGVLRVPGRLVGTTKTFIGGVIQHAIALAVDPEAVEQLNRRAHYRVSSALKGEITIIHSEDLSAELEIILRERAQCAETRSRLHLLSETIANGPRRCVIRDLSLGGARLSTESPPPRPQDVAILDLALGPGDVLRHLMCEVVEGRPGRTPPPLDTQVRVRFSGLSRKEESRISRYVAQVQREMLKKGIKT